MTTTNQLTERRIPAELADRLTAVFGLSERPATIDDLADVFQAGSGAPPRLEDLYSDRPSRHQVTIDAETRYTHCVMDALLLAIAAGDSADIRSTSPTSDGVVALHVRPDGVRADPPTAVVSFGVARADRGAVQQTACPYINVFGSEDEYARWAAATPEAATMSLPLDEAVALTRAMAGPGTTAAAPGSDQAEGCCC